MVDCGKFVGKLVFVRYKDETKCHGKLMPGSADDGDDCEFWVADREYDPLGRVEVIESEITEIREISERENDLLRECKFAETIREKLETVRASILNKTSICDMTTETAIEYVDLVRGIQALDIELKNLRSLALREKLHFGE